MGVTDIDVVNLRRPTTEWPLILCGPIVRQVTRTSAAVFVATKSSFTGSLWVYDGTTIDTPVGAGVAQDSVKLGEMLHVCVLQVTGLELEPGRIYGYDVKLDSESSVHTLATLGLLDSNVLAGYVPLGYDEGALPSFVLPGPLDRLKIAHGSCRKPHGCHVDFLTDPDILPMIDRLIQDSRTDPYDRPQQLLLTGDQIYSDDVPAALLAAVTSVGRDLMQWTNPETFPDLGPVPGPPLEDDSVVLDPGKRSTFLDNSGIKDRPAGAEGWEDYAANHLLFFSEWCAMYLFAWSPEMWQTRDAVDEDDRDAHPTHTYFVLPEATEAWAESPDTTSPTLIYAQGLHYVRRALANVSTYMIFDDHDVTDDWFLNKAVDEQLRDKDGGRRLMRNALAAYAVFQHWGNDPAAFGPGTRGSELLALLDADDPNHIGKAGNESGADQLLDVGPTAVGVDDRDQRMRWDFELVCDEHRLLFLDVRTWRGYPSGQRHIDPPALLQAASDRTDELSDWGTTALRDVAGAWSDAYTYAVGDVRPFMLSGRLLLEHATDLTESLAGNNPAWDSQADLLLEEVLVYLDLIEDAPVFANQAWVGDVLDAASGPIVSASIPDGGPTIEAAMALSAVLNETSYELRTGTTAWLADEGLAHVDEAELAASQLLLDLADMFNHLASFVQGSVVSNRRAARFGSAFARTWLTINADKAALMWGDLFDGIAEPLADAAVAVSEPFATLEDLYEEHKGIVDTVWDLLVEDETKRLNAALISSDALEFQIGERLAHAANERELTLVVSPAPVIGHFLVEFVQRLQILKAEYLGQTGDEDWDNEPWGGNIPALTKLLDSLAELGSVVFLSGDVHYAFSSVTDYVSRRGTPARFVQLTSSATKNADWKTRLIGNIDETTEDLESLAMAELDFLDLLPTLEELGDIPSDAWEAFWAQDSWATTIPEWAAEVREDLGDRVDAARQSWIPDWSWEGMRESVVRARDEKWYELSSAANQKIEEVATSITDHWENPAKLIIGDQIQTHPLVQEQILLLFDQLGVSADALPELHTTVLFDRRADERLDDSPDIGARINAIINPVTRKIRVRVDRKTVGHDNMGVITTQRTPLGRYLTHDLHWFPFDSPVDEEPVDPKENEPWRGDWIITRHSAGLVAPAPPDGGAVGAPQPGEVVAAEFDIDITSSMSIQDGQRRIHQIDPAGPTMPDLTVSTRGVGLTAAADASLLRSVRLTCTYKNDRRDDVTYFPGETANEWVDLPAGVTDWQPDIDALCGGEIQAFVKMTSGGGDVAATEPGAHVVWGVNPLKQEIRDHAGDRVEVHVALHRESRFTQFADSPADIGRTVTGPHTVLRSFDHGYGLGQLTNSPVPDSFELWDWRANVDNAVGRFDDLEADALTYVDQVRTGLSWDDATGVGSGTAPPNEGTAYPNAPDLTRDQLHLEMWSRYNSGRRYHNYDPASGTWQQQPTANPGVTVYAPELLEQRNLVEGGTFPRGWN